MKAQIALAFAALSLAACGGNPQIKAAQETVKAQLVNPSAASFEDVQVGAAGVVCGWVNPANSRGLYAGAERFIVKNGITVFPNENMVELRMALDAEQSYPDRATWNGAFSECLIYAAEQTGDMSGMERNVKELQDYADMLGRNL